MSTYPAEPKRRGLALTIIGVVMMVVLAPAAFIIGTIVGVTGGLSVITDAPLVQPGDTVEMKAGQTRDIYAYVGQSASDNGVDTNSSTVDTPDCTVNSPSGAPVEVTAGGGRTTWTRDSGQYASAGSFTATEAGNYRISCGDAAALVPDGKEASRAANTVGWGIGGGLVGATLLGILGLILLIVGIVKLSNSGKERSQFRLQQQMNQWNQNGPGGYNQPYGGYRG